MALSIPELDATVRTFYEGRGEQVRFPNISGNTVALLCSY